jgi:hypothetical protein
MNTLKDVKDIVSQQASRETEMLEKVRSELRAELHAPRSDPSSASVMSAVIEFHRQIQAEISQVKAELSQTSVLSAIQECRNAISSDQVQRGEANSSKEADTAALLATVLESQRALSDQVKAEVAQLRNDVDPTRPIQQCTDAISQQVKADIHFMQVGLAQDKTLAAIKECQKSVVNLVRSELNSMRSELGGSSKSLVAVVQDCQRSVAKQAEKADVIHVEVKEMHHQRQQASADNFRRIQTFMDNVKSFVTDVKACVDLTPVIEAVQQNRVNLKPILDAVRNKPDASIVLGALTESHKAVSEQVKSSMEALRARIDAAEKKRLADCSKNFGDLTPVLDAIAQASPTSDIAKGFAKVLEAVERNRVDITPVSDAMFQVNLNFETVKSSMDLSSVIAAVQGNRVDLDPVLTALTQTASSIEGVKSDVLAALDRSRVDLSPTLNAMAQVSSNLEIINSSVEDVKSTIDVSRVLAAVEKTRVDMMPILDAVSKVSALQEHQSSLTEEVFQNVQGEIQGLRTDLNPAAILASVLEFHQQVKEELSRMKGDVDHAGVMAAVSQCRDAVCTQVKDELSRMKGEVDPAAVLAAVSESRDAVCSQVKDELAKSMKEVNSAALLAAVNECLRACREAAKETSVQECRDAVCGKVQDEISRAKRELDPSLVLAAVKSCQEQVCSGSAAFERQGAAPLTELLGQVNVLKRSLDEHRSVAEAAGSASRASLEEVKASICEQAKRSIDFAPVLTELQQFRSEVDYIAGVNLAGILRAVEASRQHVDFSAVVQEFQFVKRELNSAIQELHGTRNS